MQKEELNKDEIWKIIMGFPQYEISNMGKVRSHQYKKFRFLSPGLCGIGYRYVILSNRGHRTSRKIATLVAEHFIGPRPSGKQVSHINENKSDDRACNLCYESQTENNNHPLYRIRQSQSQRIGATGYRGVRKTSSGKYAAHIGHADRVIYLGTFLTVEEAARAFDAKAIELRGAYAVTNKSLGYLKE